VLCLGGLGYVGALARVMLVDYLVVLGCWRGAGVGFCVWLVSGCVMGVASGDVRCGVGVWYVMVV